MEKEKTISFQINKFAETQNFRDFLVSKYRAFKKVSVEQVFAEKRFEINGKLANEKTVVTSGDILTFRHSSKFELSPEPEFRVIFEDENILVISKDNCVPVTPISFVYFNSLVIFLREEFQNPELSPVNRLDIETTGVMIFSKKKNFTKRLTKIFEKRKIYKEYFCVVFGKANFSEKLVKGELVRDSESKIFTKFKLLENETPNSETNFTLLNSEEKPKAQKIFQFYEEGNFSYLKAIPKTGKTNQIRIHSSSLSLPIVGDKKYFPDEKVYLDWFENDFTEEVQSKLLTKRQLLHCYKNEFVHPITKELISCTSEPKENS
ncbi:MAG: RluA family pseudouridine synthase [Calditrichaeota bacterium]|nr:MAG: RluA family pseudouridine synthase [Calditrichota bacterium]